MELLKVPLIVHSSFLTLHLLHSSTSTNSTNTLLLSPLHTGKCKDTNGIIKGNVCAARVRVRVRMRVRACMWVRTVYSPSLDEF
jgi:hypothetical protein